jgi:hypothetical protein
VISRWAETGWLPPADGVMVRAVLFPDGFLTLIMEFGPEVWTSAMPTSWLLPAARPTTVQGSSTPSSARTSCPASEMLTWNITW